MAGARQKLVGLLDYIEQVVRLDERVVFRTSEYRLSDGSTFAVSIIDTHDLPGVRHDSRDEEGPVWLEIERLARNEPPAPPKDIADWIVLSPDPARLPEARSYRLMTVTAEQRDTALAKRIVRPEDVLTAPRKGNEKEGIPPKFDLRLRLADRPQMASAINIWIAGPWTNWARAELPRRRTIALYQQFYKIFQMLEVGSSESSVELIWGVGIVQWKKDSVILDRPLLERRVEIELDDVRGGLIRVRPTSADATFDLKPYEQLGCLNLPSLSDLTRSEIQKAGEDEGISPFIRQSFETILSAAATRLDRDGQYLPDVGPITPAPSNASNLTVTDRWVIFARPRSQHVVLQDIDRLRESAESEQTQIQGLPERLVTEPSSIPSAAAWKPLSPKIGGTDPGKPITVNEELGDIFFPKPFNDDQIEILRRISRADGFVVQGPPGTGKTHTIANLICHAMATGQRVLVVSHGESALAVLKGQLPKEVQPLAIAVLSNERAGLRQIESAIREIQSVVETTRPDVRYATITRLEHEIQDAQGSLKKIDQDLDQIAEMHLTKLGPRAETSAALAQRIVSERKAYSWFTDRPLKFAADAGVSDSEIASLLMALGRIGNLIDHLGVSLPAPSDLPDAELVARWHEDLIAADKHGKKATEGPAQALHISASNADSAAVLAPVLERFGRVQQVVRRTSWLAPLWRSASKGEHDPLSNLLREIVTDADRVYADCVNLLRRSVELPLGLLDNQEARAAIDRGAAGQKLWSLIALGKSEAKALIAAVKVDGDVVRDGDTETWIHVAAVTSNALRQRQVHARWDAFAKQIGAPFGQDRNSAIEFCQVMLRVCEEMHGQAPLFSRLVANTFTLEAISNDFELCLNLAEQIKAASTCARLSTGEHERQRVLNLFQNNDETSVQVRKLFSKVLGRQQFASVEQVRAVWRALIVRLETLKARAPDFEIVTAVTHAIAAAGAPMWAKQLRENKSMGGATTGTWREAWDYAAGEHLLSRIDRRKEFRKLAEARVNLDRQSAKLFSELVRERTFYELDRRLSPSIKSSLVEFVRALAKIGKGTGKTAWIHRRTARDAMSRCYDAVPCWIMPTWRVAEQLPAEFGAVDLVIIDEASQSDVTELPALLRGKKILVVGDDRQVSPTRPFVTQEKIDQLRHHYLGALPFKSLLEPGESIYDLMRAVFPNDRLMLKEHFRCVEPIVRFSMQFYPEKMLPLRLPNAHERLDPPLVDIYVPRGARSKSGKVNEAEAEVVVDEVAALTAKRDMQTRTIGIISLIGFEQAELIRKKLSERIGEELMQRHAILCGDSATFQGTERDIIFLSMVADPANKNALTMLRYEQRFNVAVSRARDRLVLVRSVRRDELNPQDLKAKLIAHFENPMPEVEKRDNLLSACESDFERDLLRKLLDLGYDVQPQVGSLGFRIDLVVEGANGVRLAVECDGDRFHGREQWQHDMRRQRTLERVGWRFWRCFASSFYREPEAVVADLVETLTSMGIEPRVRKSGNSVASRYTEFRTISLPIAKPTAHKLEPPTSVLGLVGEREDDAAESGINVGDKVVIVFSDDSRRISARLTNGANELEKGQLSITSPLGHAILGAEEGDEIDIQLDGGRHRKILIEAVEKANVAGNGSLHSAHHRTVETESSSLLQN